MSSRSGTARDPAQARSGKGRTLLPLVAVAATLLAAAAWAATPRTAAAQSVSPPPQNAGAGSASTAGGIGASLKGSYCEGLCGGIGLIVTPSGNVWVIPQGGVGFGPSVSATVGSSVADPNGPTVTVNFSGSDQFGPVGYKASATLSDSLDNPGLSVTGNVGLNLGEGGATVPGLGNVQLQGKYSPSSGLTGGVNYSATGQFFDVSGQASMQVQYPIKANSIYTVGGPDENGVLTVSQPGVPFALGPSVTYTRDPSVLGTTYNPDGSEVIRTQSGDITVYGQQYVDIGGGQDPGKLTHNLIDVNGQLVDSYTWEGDNGSYIMMDSAGTRTEYLDANGHPSEVPADGPTVSESVDGVITQTNPDGSSVTYDPKANTITTNNGGVWGTGVLPTVTTYNLTDGSVVQEGPTQTVPVTPPAIPPSVSPVPHDPQVAQLRTDTYQSANPPANPSNSGPSNSDSSGSTSSIGDGNTQTPAGVVPGTQPPASPTLPPVSAPIPAPPAGTATASTEPNTDHSDGTSSTTDNNSGSAPIGVVPGSQPPASPSLPPVSAPIPSPPAGTATDTTQPNVDRGDGTSSTTDNSSGPAPIGVVPGAEPPPSPALPPVSAPIPPPPASTPTDGTQPVNDNNVPEQTGQPTPDSQPASTPTDTAPATAPDDSGTGSSTGGSVDVGGGGGGGGGDEMDTPSVDTY